MSVLLPQSVALCVPAFRESLVGFRQVISALDPAPGALLAVDDGSGDGTNLRLQDAGFEVIIHEQNLGLGAARNTLWQRAEELGFSAVAYLDADVHPAHDYLSRVCSLLGSDELAGVGGRNIDEHPQGRADRWRARFWPQQLGEQALLNAPMLIGACASYRISALRDVGGFDPEHRTHGEDVDVGRRLRAYGHRLHYDPDLVVRHTREDNELTLLRGCYRHCREGMRATLRTPGGAAEPFSLVFGMGRKWLRAPLASLLRRRDLSEAVLGSAACSAGMLGYLVAWADAAKTPRGRST
jgi:GT2 family glycosyltransferase